MTTNRRILLARRPVGAITGDCFETVEEPVPEPGDGEALMRVEYLSLDPAMRGWMSDEPSYLPPVGIGEVMRSAASGTVVESRSELYPVGATVMGMVGWQDYALLGGPNGALAGVMPEGVDALGAASVFGVTGLTAYFGVTDIGRPNEGETFVVSGAAGGVGSIAGQIAKLRGCRVVGIAGTPEKCAWVVDELGFDACIDYRSRDVRAALGDECPAGIDVYFDNVGGGILEAALWHMNQHGRIVACGMISRYNDVDAAPGPSNLNRIVSQRLRMEGFILLDHLARFPEAMEQLGAWLSTGALRSRVHVVEGLLEAPHAITMLFTGENVGKLVVRA